MTVTRPARQLPTTGTETAGLGAVGLLLTLGGTALYMKIGRPDVPSSPAMANRAPATTIGSVQLWCR